MDTQPLLQPESNRGAWRWFLASAAFAVLGVVAFMVDSHVAQWCIQDKLPGDLKKIFDFSEAFGHGVGITLILITMFVLDPNHRRQFPRMIACLLAVGLGANLVKMMVARYRPKAFDNLFDWTQSIFVSFHKLFPLGDGGHSLQSFPSAHTTGAVALACCLSFIYPRGRWWFATLAALVALQRINAGAHFVSDTCFGAALGILISAFFLKTGPLARSFTRFEQK
ncbi:MAG: phosphatase PAP2 family protein, partial [Planctomycetia bacterium]